MALSLCLACLVALGWMTRERFVSGKNDFLQLYCGARLLGSTGLYDPETNMALQERLVGARLPSVIYARPPFYAWLLKPLTRFPYRIAYAIFVLCNVAALCWLLTRLSAEVPDVAVFAALFPPLYASVLAGQDAAILAALLWASHLLMRERRDFAAGLLLSLCAIKAHLVVLVPIALVALCRWRVLGGGLLGGCALTAVSFLAAGPLWLEDYLLLLNGAAIHPSPDLMPNLSALRAALGAGGWLHMLIASGVAILVPIVARRSASLELGLASALAGSLVISTHAYMQDALLLLLSFTLVYLGCVRKGLRTAWFVTISTLPAGLLLMGKPWSAVLPLLTLTALVLTAKEALRSPSPCSGPAAA